MIDTVDIIDIVAIVDAVAMVDIVHIVDIVYIVNIVDIVDTVYIIDIVDCWLLKQSQKPYLISTMGLRDGSTSKKCFVLISSVCLGVGGLHLHKIIGRHIFSNPSKYFIHDWAIALLFHKKI